ncbi:MAG: cysteine desulfurase [Pseudomonadota bacterium]
MTSMPKIEAPLDVRADFPQLATQMNGKPLAFLDSAASSLKAQPVLDAVMQAYAHDYATVHRGIYSLSQEMTERYEAARRSVASFIGAASDKEVVFTRGATEAINLVASSWGETHLKAGDEVLITQMEHHSNIIPWQLLRDKIGIVLKVADITDDGVLDWDSFSALLGEKTKLVAITHMSNVLGTVVDIPKVVTAAHAVGAKVLVDGCQSAPHMPVDMAALGCDFYVFSGHKIHAPTGIGVLWGRYDVLESMRPYQGGGSMIEEVTFEESTYLKPPLRFEAGTPHFVGAIGLGAAIEYMRAIGMERVHAHEQSLLAYATEQLAQIKGLTIHGTAAPKGGILSFTMEGVHPHDIGTILDRGGVAIRAGHHCAQPLMERLGVGSTARASFALYSNEDDVDRLVAGLESVSRIFG